MLTSEIILEKEKILIDAIKRSDLTRLNDLLHSELLFLAPNGEVVTKEADLDSHRNGGMKVEQLIPTFENIKIDGDTALVVVVYETKGSMFGNPILGRFRYVRFWKNFSDGLKIIGGSCIQL